MCIAALLLKVHNKLLWNGELLAVDHYRKGIYWDPVNDNVLFKKWIFICRFLFFASRVAGSLNDFCYCFFNFNFNDLKKPNITSFYFTSVLCSMHLEVRWFTKCLYTPVTIALPLVLIIIDYWWLPHGPLSAREGDVYKVSNYVQKELNKVALYNLHNDCILAGWLFPVTKDEAAKSTLGLDPSPVV